MSTEPASAESNFASFGAAVQRRASTLVGSGLFWLLALGALFLLFVGRSLAIPLPKAPELRIPLPAFELLNQRGEKFSLADLRGRLWVADFVFTSCPTVCPKLTKRMEEIQHRTRNLGPAFHLVTFTVDPENDTPEKLAAYAEAYHANPRRWSFLTGALGELETTVVKGFKIAMGKEEVTPGIFSIFHGERLVLVDREGSIRGYYEANDEGIDVLMRDLKILANLND